MARTQLHMANGQEIIDISPDELMGLIAQASPSPWIEVTTERIGLVKLNTYMIVAFWALEEQ